MTTRVTTSGIVTKQSQGKDGTRLLSILTPDYGIVKVSVKPKGKSGSLNAAISQFLSYGSFTTVGDRGIPIMTESSPIDNFLELYNDLEKLSLATYFADAVYSALGMNNPDENVYRLFLNSVYALAKLDIPQSKIKLAFEAKLCSLSGYAPQLNCCSTCGDISDILYFDTEKGEAFCGICKRNGTFAMNQEELALFKYVSGADLKKLFAFRVSDETINTISMITENYLSEKLGVEIKSLEYYKRLIKE